jgi:hypothetical protein
MNMAFHFKLPVYHSRTPNENRWQLITILKTHEYVFLSHSDSYGVVTFIFVSTSILQPDIKPLLMCRPEALRQSVNSTRQGFPFGLQNATVH